MKKCSACRVEKDESLFSKRRDGLNSKCKACHKVYVDNHYQQNKEYYANKRAKHSKRERKKYIDHKKSLSCTDCGLLFKDEPFLCEFHHLDPTKKDVNPSFFSSGFNKFLKEIKKCIPLCCNCHRRRHHNEKQ